ncbi:hypothetical protein BX666DRAFT_2018967 [Dichotomocladium elegans]|nr:hypothetical protein BX666DRAFT_2018967 [Dichotomocladium elegans]
MRMANSLLIFIQFKTPMFKASSSKILSQRLDAPWDDITACHLKTIVHLDHGNYFDAYDSQKEMVQLFQRIMPSLSRWCLPVLYVTNNDLRAVAAQADLHTTLDEGQQESTQRKKLEEAANVISKSFTSCLTDRNPLAQSKKYGTYSMIGILFRIYFKLKQQNLCKNILRALKAVDMPSIENFSPSDRVTFRYYLGRFHFLEEDYSKAENELDLAFKECPQANMKNKELILQILLPIRLMRGVMPSKSLFAQFPKTRVTYSNIVKSIKKGDIKAFDRSLYSASRVLIRQGTYFAVEKARNIAIRQLFYRIYLIMDKNPRIPIPTFNAALKATGIDVDIEETEWIIATMIYKGYIKGYLSHEKLFAVLSKVDPFPKIVTVGQ